MNRNKQNVLQTKLLILPPTITTANEIIQWLATRTWPRIIDYTTVNKELYLRNPHRPGYQKHFLAFANSNENTPEYQTLKKTMSNVCDLDAYRPLLACAVVSILIVLKF